MQATLLLTFLDSLSVSWKKYSALQALSQLGQNVNRVFMQSMDLQQCIECMIANNGEISVQLAEMIAPNGCKLLMLILISHPPTALPSTDWGMCLPWAAHYSWETGYWASMDIAHDRAGYYLCWGCLNWVPAIYTSPALHLVSHPVQLGIPLAAANFLAGAACIYINYDSDRQRQVCHASAKLEKTEGLG